MERLGLGRRWGEGRRRRRWRRVDLLDLGLRMCRMIPEFCFFVGWVRFVMQFNIVLF